ncbi:acyltransferase family protein [Paraburkholderia bryophila]|uniref:acyltransferase family protein n=1 Tax=Paraburkholderia bryophila TaxID=420952 RepID=UPI00142E5597|nr:acyltransferase [Paraburkholderia bryophila]
MKNQRLEFANALRGVAALSVLISHYLGIFWFARPITEALINAPIADAAALPTPAIAAWLESLPIASGPFGVALFFMISGFVIPFSFERSSVAGFLIGRFFRIYPLYFAGFTVTLVAVYLSGLASGRSFPYALFHVLAHYVPGVRDLLWLPSIDGIVWTLEIELKFYLLCALLAPLLRTGSLKVFLAPVLLFCIAIAAHRQPWGTLEKTFAFDSEYMLMMFCGVAFNFYFRPHITNVMLSIIGPSCLAMFCVSMYISGDLPVRGILGYIAAFATFAVCASLSSRWPSSHTLSFFADVSYPLYVVHGVMGYAVMAHMVERNVAPSIAIACAFALSIIVAWTLHKMVEKPSHEIGKRLSQSISTGGRPGIAADS